MILTERLRGYEGKVKKKVSLQCDSLLETLMIPLKAPNLVPAVLAEDSQWLFANFHVFPTQSGAKIVAVFGGMSYISMGGGN